MMHIRVLLVDDHQVVRRGIREFLEDTGEITVVAEAENAAQALDMAAEYQPDVIVLDIKLPDQSGIEVAKALRTAGSSTGILILTAYDDDPYVQAALDVGVNGYVMKSADADDVIDAVIAVHEGQHVFNQALLQRAQQNPPQQEALVEPLTSRELEVLQLAVQGLTNKAIGYQLGISNRTVQGHLANIYSKLNVSGRTEMTSKALAMRLISLEL